MTSSIPSQPVHDVGKAAMNVAGKFKMLTSPDRYPCKVKPGFRTGPVDPEGIMADISDRPTLCSAANWKKTGGGEVRGGGGPGACMGGGRGHGGLGGVRGGAGAGAWNPFIDLWSS